MTDGTFATAITCMDGRVQEPMRKWAMKEFGVDFVDVITDAGVDLQLTQSLIWQDDKFKGRVTTSVNKHGSRNVVLVGHHDCAGNPVTEEQHKVMIAKSCEKIISWGFPVRVVGLWIGADWQPEVVCDTGK